MGTTRITGGGSPEEIPDRVNGEVVTKVLEIGSVTSRIDGAGSPVETVKYVQNIVKGPAGIDNK